MNKEQRDQAIEKIAKWQWARDGYPREMVTNRDPGPGYYFTRAEALYDGALAPLLAEELRAGAEQAWARGRDDLLAEMGGTWHYYSTDHPTLNPYRADRIAQDQT